MAAPAAGPAAPQHEVPSPALAAALARNDHAALRQASTPEVLEVFIAAYGGAGSPALLAALAAGGHAALRAACARDDWPALTAASDAQYLRIWERNCDCRTPMIRLLLNAYGGRGSDGLSDALASAGAGCLLSASRLADAHILCSLIDSFCHAGSGALLAALAAGGGRHARHAALLSVGDSFDKNISVPAIFSARNLLIRVYGERGMAALLTEAAAEGGEELDYFLYVHGNVHGESGYKACYILRCPVAWQPGSGGRQPLARRMCNAATRAQLALPVLCALNRLPIAGPLLSFLRQRPWLLYAADIDRFSL
jgi:hypothetical protein